MSLFARQVVVLPATEQQDISLLARQVVVLPATDVATDLVVRQLVVLAVRDYASPEAPPHTSRASFVG